MADNSWLYNPNNSSFLNYGQNYNASTAFSSKPKIQPISPTSLKSWTPSYKSKADVISFQKAMGLNPDGIIGPKTQAAYAQMGVNVPMNIKTSSTGTTTQSKVTTPVGKKLDMKELYSDYTAPTANTINEQPVQQVITTNGPIAGNTVTPAMFSNPLINPVYQGTINGQPVSVEQGQLGSLDAGSITGFNQMGGDYTGYSMPNAGTTSSLGNTSFANGLSNSMNLPNGQVSPSSGWDKYLSSFTTTNKPYGSYGEAWSQGNKEGGVLGGISNLWNQFTTEGGTVANPTASGLEKGMQGLGQLASLYGGIQQAKYQKDLMNLANRQQAFQEAQTNRVNSMQDQAQANYANSFNV